MPLAGVAWSPWLFWDGRRDSLWSQALTPLEDAVEHAGNRTAYAHFMAANFHERYERIFGPLPLLDGLPDNAGPLGNDCGKGRLGRDERGPAQGGELGVRQYRQGDRAPSSAR